MMHKLTEISPVTPLIDQPGRIIGAVAAQGLLLVAAVAFISIMVSMTLMTFCLSLVDPACQIRTTRLEFRSSSLRPPDIRFPGVLLAVLMCFFTGVAFAGEEDDGLKGKASTPNLYLDMRTTYAKVPAGTLAIGFGNSAVVTALQSAAISNAGSLAAIAGGATLPGAQSVVVDLPMTVDVTDDVSLYAGVSASSTGTPTAGWSSVAITSWNLGFQANLYNQNGGSLPTVSWQSTITEAIPNGPLATTTFTNVFEFDYALDQDETRGLLAGVQDTRVIVGSPLAKIHPDIMGYVGGYYQWPNNWKFTGRAGVQVFGGAQLLNLVSVPSFTQPIVRLDLDRMDDNDNRLFGVTAQIMWAPKPAYQLTLRTPLYFVRN